MTDYRVAIFGGMTTQVVYAGEDENEYHRVWTNLQDVFRNIDYYTTYTAHGEKDGTTSDMSLVFFVD